LSISICNAIYGFAIHIFDAFELQIQMNEVRGFPIRIFVPPHQYW